MKLATQVSRSKRVKPSLPRAVAAVLGDNQGLVEKGLLGLRLLNAMFIDIFA